MKPSILILYSAGSSTIRPSVRDNIRIFDSLKSTHQIAYLNVAYITLPKYILKFDIIVLHTTLLAERWSEQKFKSVQSHTNLLSEYEGHLVAFPQDEFLMTGPLSRWMASLSVRNIYGLVPKLMFGRVYKELVDNAEYNQILSGYLPVGFNRTQVRDFEDRCIDIGYRAWAAEPWLGKIARDKLLLQEINSYPEGESLSIDVSCDADLQFTDDDWDDFVANCRWQLVSPGGASILDREGILRSLYRNSGFAVTNIFEFDRAYEALGFDKYEETLDLQVLTPRIIDCARNGTALIAFEGEYNGLLQANLHFLPLRRDFSNLPEVFHLARNPEVWQKMSLSLQELVFESGHFDSRSVVSLVERDFNLINNYAIQRIPQIVLRKIESLECISNMIRMFRFSIFAKVIDFFRFKVLGTRPS